MSATATKSTMQQATAPRAGRVVVVARALEPAPLPIRPTDPAVAVGATER